MAGTLMPIGQLELLADDPIATEKVFRQRKRDDSAS